VSRDPGLYLADIVEACKRIERIASSGRGTTRDRSLASGLKEGRGFRSRAYPLETAWRRARSPLETPVLSRR